MLVAAAGGCLQPATSGPKTTEQEELLRRRVGQLERQEVTLREEIEDLQFRVQQLQRLGPKRLELLNPPVRVEIERLSGGYDDDGAPGDDGVVVYLRPIDAEGDVIKAAGDIEIQLWNLAGTPDELLVGQYVLDAEHAREQWYGRLLTNHYTIKCPWRAEPPAHNEITVRALFTDYLTGKLLTDQRVCRIVLPSQSARDPQDH